MPTWSCNSSLTVHPPFKIAGVTRRSFQLCRHQHICPFVAHANCNTRAQSQAHTLAAWGAPAMGKAKSAAKPASTNSSCYLQVSPCMPVAMPLSLTAGKHCCLPPLQILGNGLDTGDTLPSVLLFFDKHRCAGCSSGCPISLLVQPAKLHHHA